MNAPATTSAAMVTSPARGGIAVVILTGPETKRIIGEIFRPRSTSTAGAMPSPVFGGGHETPPDTCLPASRESMAPGEPSCLSLGRIVSGDEVLDEAIVSHPADGVVEINIHGGLHVARKVLSLLAERGARIVSDCPVDPVLLEVQRPGLKNPAIMKEFLSALRMASTPLAASAVSCQWSGGLSSLVASQQPKPDHLRAAADVLPLMRKLLEPAEVVIAGPPNVGKSALANALIGRNVAVVSDKPGTTRDWVRTLTDADGVPIRLTDTAGLWSDAKGIDAEAVRRAWDRIESADLLICVTAEADGEYGGLVEHLRSLPNVINVAGKCDVLEPTGCGDLAVSAETLTGIDALRRAIRDNLGFADFDPTAAMAFTVRQADHLRAAAESLDRSDQAGARLALNELLKADG